MNHDEFAFFNRQLAEMLRSGIPLEGSLRQLAATMQSGALRDEIQLLEADLAKGTPLREALLRRKLPDLFIRLAHVGAEGNDLPGVLVLLGDYYQRRHALWMQLKALLVYPAIVLVAALALSLFMVWLYQTVLSEAAGQLVGPEQMPAAVPIMVWLPPVWLAAAAALCALAGTVPAWRNRLRWSLPGFRESNTAQLAAAMHLLLARGGNLAESIDLVRHLESGTPAGRELDRWLERIAEGQGRFAEFAAGPSVFPGLFLWLVGQGGEDLATSFRRAADIYYQRARHRTEMMLYAALPVAVLALGALILAQLSPSMLMIVHFINRLGGD